MPAILSPCILAECLGIWLSFFQTPIHTPVPDGLFYEDDLLFLPRPQRHIGVVWTIWVNCNIPPRSTSISHDWAFCSRLVLAVVGGFLPTKLAQWVRSASCPTCASLLVSGVRRLLTSVGRRCGTAPVSIGPPM